MYVVYVHAGGVGACAIGTLLCQAGALQCVPNAAASVESCNGIDDDCDGMYVTCLYLLRATTLLTNAWCNRVDEGNPDGGAACATGLLRLSR